MFFRKANIKDLDMRSAFLEHIKTIDKLSVENNRLYQLTIRLAGELALYINKMPPEIISEHEIEIEKLFGYKKIN